MRDAAIIYFVIGLVFFLFCMAEHHRRHDEKYGGITFFTPGTLLRVAIISMFFWPYYLFYLVFKRPRRK